MKLSIECVNPVQAHSAMNKTIWPQLKNALIDGQRMVLEIKPSTRSLEQNARLWAMLTDISRQVDWYGRKLTPYDWKHMFTASLKKQDVVPGIDGGFVVLGASTSKMTKAEMCDLQTLMEAFGAEKGVRFTA
jgi:NinB protein